MRRRSHTLCTVCKNPIDPIWVEIGETKHVSCIPPTECEHGEPRGPHACPFCRRKHPALTNA